ncbi:hypothetical protein LguiB_019395 [Lonicera macranthoides]
MRKLTFDLHLWWKLLSIFALTNQSFGLNRDGILLLSFKYSVLSDPLGVLDSWSYSDQTPCSWNGVTCGTPSISDDTYYHVTAITLPNSLLIGSIPADIGMIQHLRYLDLSNNSINGSIPMSFFNLTELQFFDFSNNLISGELPELIGGLKSLWSLNLSDNALAGELPGNITSLGNLTVLSLKGNYFTGNLPSGFDSTQFVDLSSNLINGSLPPDFGGDNIRYLNVSYNRLSGKIPVEFGNKIPQNATIDLSFNNLSGEIPESKVFTNQDRNSFSGNSQLCGKPLENLCNPIPSTMSAPPEPNVSAPTSPPAIAAIPKTIPSNPATNSPAGTSNASQRGLRTGTIVGIVVGDIAGIGILALIFIYIYQLKKKKPNGSKEYEWSWACLVKRKNHEEESTESSSTEDEEEAQKGRVEPVPQAQKGSGSLVTVDGEKELELESLLKASAYILGASGSSIMYKAVLEDGSTFAVRRIGESGVERFRDFENQVRVISKLVHPNLVRIRGFYWGVDEKLVIYDFVPNGSLVNARYRKVGSSPCPLPWEVRLKIAKGVARGLAFIHDKKHVHANLKPSNILLESDMEPKIGDFGLERLVTGENSSKAGASVRNFGSKRSTGSRDSFHDVGPAFNPSPSPSSLGGVSPYYAPESLRSLKPNPKWDVYSFGVLFLELLTGKVVTNSDEFGVEDKSRVLRMADVAIRSEMEGREDALLALLKLGYSCISLVPQNRPPMKEVVQILEKFPSSYTSFNYYGP